jgi:multidrug resistance efflux pump
LDIKSKASGNLVYLNTTANGQAVKKGDLIAKVDTRDALISLESARIAYAKLV